MIYLIGFFVVVCLIAYAITRDKEYLDKASEYDKRERERGRDI